MDLREWVRSARGPASRVVRRRSTAQDVPVGSTVVELDGTDALAVSVLAEGGAEQLTAPDGDPPPGAPGPVIDRGADRAAVVRLWALGVLIVTGLLVVGLTLALTQPPSVAQLRDRAGWSDLQVLRVGVSGDVPGVSECSSRSSCTGFDVGIAYLVADWLGLPRSAVEFYEVLPEDRHRMRGRDFETRAPVDLDLVAAAYSITDERVRADRVVFAGPYLVTETSVLTRVEHSPVESLSDLARGVPEGEGTRPQRICTPGTTTSAQYLAQAVGGGAQVHHVQRNTECVKGLLEGREDAAVTDAAILAGFADENRKTLRLNNISSTIDEYWGIGLGVDRTGEDPRIQSRRQLVLLALDDLLTAPGQDGWRQAYRSAFGGLRLGERLEPGQELQPVAIDRQPPPEGLEKVRRWPWERTGQVIG